MTPIKDQAIDIKTYFTPRGKANRAGWIFTYADMITLLLTFFILSLAIAGEIKKNIYREIDRILTKEYEDIQRFVDNEGLSKAMQVKRETKGIHITIASGALFESGKAEIKKQIIPALTQIRRAIINADILRYQQDLNIKRFIAALKKTGKTIDLEVRVEGHTDNLPIQTQQYPSNWELSHARALSVVKLLTMTGKLPEKMFTVSGYSKHRPIAPNNSAFNRAKNRRVEIYIDAELMEINNH